ncbi:techylectin-5A-like [Dreissena polymorpha]|uniref:Fibrinogen C-terminal domain-containing protein n=1 Tax=Dreissena polymorpha TaxID=45954 RepID=A0A9D3YMM3_DREPO|nr:techylectin-5A-like [Dreissena polymorpha]KAH3701589.1 hypothetical protein DPMN_076578 [Dreissena polymorpha]
MYTAKNVDIFRYVALFLVVIVHAEQCHRSLSVVKGCNGSRNCTTGWKHLLRSDQLAQTLAGVSPFLSEEYNRRCNACAEQRNLSATPRDCREVYHNGDRTTGVYTIYPMAIKASQVVCDMATDGGGWTVLQRRVSDTDFYKTWSEYQSGFGDPQNFWLGNENIWALTSTRNYSLRIDLTAPDGQTAYARYSSFKIENFQSRYRLHISGYSGTAGDSLGGLRHNGYVFSTKDMDSTAGCPALYRGGWWYDTCHSSNLNGVYNNTTYGMGLNWFSWKGYHVSMVRTEMKIK